MQFLFNSFSRKFLGFVMIGLFAASVVSCGDDPVLTGQVREQQLEITKLQGELALVEEKLRNLPPDRSEELAAARQREVVQLGEIKELQAKLDGLQARKRELEREFDAYRRKYVIR